MAIIRQFGSDGGSYNTDDYPFILMRNEEIDGRFSTEEKAHQGRLMTALNNQEDNIMLYNEKTKKFIKWRKRELRLFEKYKNDPSKYFEGLMRKN